MYGTWVGAHVKGRTNGPLKGGQQNSPLTMIIRDQRHGKEGIHTAHWKRFKIIRAHQHGNTDRRPSCTSRFPNVLQLASTSAVELELPSERTSAVLTTGVVGEPTCAVGACTVLGRRAMCTLCTVDYVDCVNCVDCRARYGVFNSDSYKNRAYQRPIWRRSKNIHVFWPRTLINISVTESCCRARTAFRISCWFSDRCCRKVPRVFLECISSALRGSRSQSC